MSAAEKARQKVLMVEIPRDELAFRIMCKATAMKPPPGMTATEALDLAAKQAPYMIPIFYAQADAAVEYFRDCINAASSVQ